MQEIRIITAEDVVGIVEQEFKEKSQLILTEAVQAVREAVSEAVRTEIAQALEGAFATELAKFRLGMVQALEEALRHVVEDPAKSPHNDDAVDQDVV